ncbi:Lipoprotein signal peptidase [Pseudovibrio sp. FO-BEG1]|uniref:Lipoprotein signal peptidase n=2 Tax=Pseudovibrio TaxID=258255 RepID=A0A1I7C407_9HYPH|nr:MULTISPECIES: signal peptidase II [Pseudovibrio]AEV36010.1 Lipoprotein signal peptidase [Pseudovibrio sp. FO-BEG1]EEA92468.1 signal peptidase II [Pseudovibrio sp. JE062]QUS56835.1 signal peptidase II [Pseudovibrio brasiliensis]SFT94151.1 signal peptidase II [Pseudovibrio denitrificans]
MKKLKVWGHHSSLVLLLAIVGLVVDQIAKFWAVGHFSVGGIPPISVGPFLDLVLVWNKGVSYGLFQQTTEIGRWGLAAFTVAASVFIWFWSARAINRLEAICLGLVLSGALSNGFDRLYYGQVVDYLYFHVGEFSWYVFNLADAWIVIGAAGLLLDTLFIGKNKDSRP